jgi:hypothetical protein
MTVVTLHPQEKWCVMAVATGNCRVVVSDFRGHCTLDKSDVDWTVWFGASCCGHLSSVCLWDWLSWLRFFKVFLRLFRQNIMSYCMQSVHVCFRLGSFMFIIFVPFKIICSSEVLNQEWMTFYRFLADGAFFHLRSVPAAYCLLSPHFLLKLTWNFESYFIFCLGVSPLWVISDINIVWEIDFCTLF